MIVAATGHRPDKLGGYAHWDPERAISMGMRYLTLLRPTRVISGMAQGWDQAVAIAAVRLAIPFDAYIPGPWQADAWPPAARRQYEELLWLADRTVTCSPATRYEPAAMQVRNIAMVNAADLMLALWDGSHGGTANCIDYAGQLRCPMLNLWDHWLDATVSHG